MNILVLGGGQQGRVIASDLAADRPVLGQAAPGLAHEPDGGVGRGPAMGRVEEGNRGDHRRCTLSGAVPRRRAGAEDGPRRLQVEPRSAWQQRDREAWVTGGGHAIEPEGFFVAVSGVCRRGRSIRCSHHHGMRSEGQAYGGRRRGAPPVRAHMIRRLPPARSPSLRRAK